MSSPKLNSCSLILLLLSCASCLDIKQLNQSLDRPRIDIALYDRLSNPFPGISIPAGIDIDSVFYPTGFPAQSFSYRTGVLVLPLLFYNRFQSNYVVTLGSKQFSSSLNDSFKKRFRALLISCEDSARLLPSPYTLTMDLQSCDVEGIYVRGSWYVYYGYSAMSGNVNHGRNASSHIRMRWELSEGSETLIGGNVMVTLKQPYLGSVNGFMIANGRRRELTKSDLNFGIPYQIEFGGRDPLLNTTHINQMVQILCLSMDRASEEILREIHDYFSAPKN